MFQASSLIDDVVVVVPPGEESATRHSIIERYGLSKVTRIVSGGATRQASVAAGLGVIDPRVSLVLIHDAARPFVTLDLIERVLAAAVSSGAAVAAVPLVDTVKRMGGERGAITIDRQGLWAAQTPQAFRTALLIQAFERAAIEGYTGTDDASLVERLGHPVVLVEGHPSNVKITTLEDLERAEATGIAPRESVARPQRSLMMRIGIGYDVHPLVEGRPLVLGGVTVPFERGLAGHSDADVLVHAIADALLGAAGQDNLGRRYPNTDPRYHNVSSLVLLDGVVRLISGLGYRIVNVDAVVIAQAPMLAPFIGTMRTTIGKALGLTEANVNVKATSHERLGALGRGEGIASQAVCLIEGGGE